MQDFTRSSYKYIKVDGKTVGLNKLYQRLERQPITDEQLAEGLRPVFKGFQEFQEKGSTIGGLTLIKAGEELALVNDKVLGLLRAQQ